MVHIGGNPIDGPVGVVGLRGDTTDLADDIRQGSQFVNLRAPWVQGARTYAGLANVIEDERSLRTATHKFDCRWHLRVHDANIK